METSTRNKQLKTKLDINLAHQEALKIYQNINSLQIPLNF